MLFGPWLGAFLNHIQGWTTVRESYSRALEQGHLQSESDRERESSEGIDGIRERGEIKFGHADNDNGGGQLPP